QSSVFMRDIGYVAEKSGRRHDVAGGSLDRLDYDRGRASANFFFDHAPQIFDRGFATFLRRTVEARWVGIRSDVITGRQRTDQRFPIDVRDRQNAGRFPVKSARESNDIG